MRLMTLILALLVVPVGHASASPVVGTLRLYKGPMQPDYPLFESLTYPPVPITNPMAAAAFVAGRAQHRLSEAVPTPVPDLQRCAEHFGKELERFQASVDAAFVYFARAQSRYLTLMMMGDARYAMSAAEQLGRLYESMEDRYSGDMWDCADAAGIVPRESGFLERALEAMHFCDDVAMHFHHPETACNTWLRDHDYTFDGNPMELTGQQRYERSDWARNGLSHIANTTNHDRP